MSPESHGLFLTEASLGEMEKVANTKLSRDPNKWEQEILDALHEQNPFLQDYNLRFHLNKSDPEAGMGVGQIIIDEKIAVPIIIDDLKLQPLDLFWYEGKLQPLAKETLEKALQATGLGTPVEPGHGEVSDVSLYGATRVPFSGKYSFAESLTFSMDDLNKALAELGREGVDYALRTSSSFANVVSKYAEARPPMKKEAMVKLASAKPVAFEPFGEIAEPGFYEVLFDGIRKMSAVALDKVVDWDGEIVPRKIAVYGVDGSFAVSEKIGGILKSAAGTVLPNDDPALEEVGFFWNFIGDSAFATLPGRIMYKGANEDGVPFIKVAELSTGKEHTVFVSGEYDGFHSADGTIFLGTDWNWAKIEKSARASDPQTANENEWPAHTIEIRNRGSLFSIHGLDVPGVAKEGETLEPFFAAVSEMIDPGDLFTLMQTAEKQGSAFAEIPTGHSWEAEEAPDPYAKHFKNFDLGPINLSKCAACLKPSRVEFLKIAQDVTDRDVENTVDALLGLNFITEENVGKFIEKIAMLEEARDVLAKTLLSARLGLQVEQGPVKTALFSIDNVIRQLQYLRDYASML